MATVSVVWRRLDGPGHDVCRVDRYGSGWRLEGSAAFIADDLPAMLAYTLDCDDEWRTIAGHITGWRHDVPIDVQIVRTSRGEWSMNGEQVAGVDGLDDLDFGFTPATNLTQLRRLSLTIGQTAELTVAWLDIFAGTLSPVGQHYQRLTDTLYAYEAPAFGYAEELEVDPVGFVVRYPRLWEAE
jgi:hypothetical protein